MPKSFWETDKKIGNNFDIILSNYSKNMPIIIIDGKRLLPTASITKEGAIEFFPDEDWKRMSIRDVINVINHELAHISLGQIEGVRISALYDRLGWFTNFSPTKPYTSNLWIRREVSK